MHTRKVNYLSQTYEGKRHDKKIADEAAIPAEPPSPMITVFVALAFRKQRCENTP